MANHALRRPLGWRRLSRVTLAAVSIAVTLAGLEVFLRWVPIRGVTYRSFYYDPVIGGKYYPHTTLIYQHEKQTEVRRRTNAWGFPDVEHALAREPGTVRIGFFGDSFVAALQMPMDVTFVRLIERDLNARLPELNGVTNRRGEPVRRVEVLAFGIEGRSTLESYLESKNWVAACEMDYVVYVFCENDPADNMARLTHSDARPYPVLAGNTFVVDDSFNQRYGYKTSWWHRAFQHVKAHSLVVSTLEKGLKEIAHNGFKASLTRRGAPEWSWQINEWTPWAARRQRHPRHGRKSSCRRDGPRWNEFSTVGRAR